MGLGAEGAGLVARLRRRHCCSAGGYLPDGAAVSCSGRRRPAQRIARQAVTVAGTPDLAWRRGAAARVWMDGEGISG